MSVDGYRVDAEARTVGGPHGPQFALDQLECVGSTLFYARSIPNDPLISYQETWLIGKRNWAISRFAFREHPMPGTTFWKIEPDLIEVDGATWHVADGFLDLGLYEGSHYELQDADEFAEALIAGEISPEIAAEVLRTLHALCQELRANGNSGQEILRRYAPGLPVP